MKLLNRLLLFMFATTLFVACDEEDYPILNPSAETVVSLSSSDIVLDKANIGADALTISWTEPSYGFDAAPNYRIIFTYGDQSNTVNAGSELSKTFETAQINKILLGLGFEGGVANQANVKVEAILSSYKSIVSNSITLTATVYEDKLDLSTNWGVVGSAYNDWGNAGPDAPFYKTSNPDVIVSYVTLMDGMMKFRLDNSWDTNYGDNGNDGSLEQNGSDIPVDAGTYKITVNTATLTWEMEKYSWGIVGSAYNDWGNDGPDFPLEYDPFTDTWRGLVTLMDGMAKFRKNNDWGENYGDNGPDGVLDRDGSDIAVTAGNYLVTVDFNSMEYSIEPIYFWGIVGSATPNSWDGPDIPMNLSFEKDDFWYANDVTLIDGMIKFRADNDWANNFGDNENDGILENGGSDIPVAAGTYNITIDFADPNAPVWTIESI